MFGKPLNKYLMKKKTIHGKGAQSTVYILRGKTVVNEVLNTFISIIQVKFC